MLEIAGVKSLIMYRANPHESPWRHRGLGENQETGLGVPGGDPGEGSETDARETAVDDAALDAEVKAR